MRLLFFIATISLLFSACQDPGSVGSGLLTGEEFDIEFTDQIVVPGKVVRGDSAAIYSNLFFKSIGVLDEPVFGETKTQLFLNASISNIVAKPDFTDATLDSVIFRMPLTSEYRYGDTTATHHVELIQLSNPITEEFEVFGVDNVSTYTEFPFDESNVIGEKTFVPDYFTQTPVNSHSVDTVLFYEPQLRLKLDNSFGQVFFDDSNTLENDSTFLAAAKGFVLRSTPSTNSMIGLDIGIARHALAFYYTRDDGTKEVYNFNLGGFSHLNVLHSYEGDGSAIEAALNDPSDDQELLYVESYSGTDIEFDLSGIQAFQDEIINYAELELTLADVPGYDTDLYPPISHFYLSTRNDEGNLRTIRDISTLGNPDLLLLEEFFGGNAVIDGLTGETKYTMNISSHIRSLIEGETDNYILTLTNVADLFEPNRSIIYGNGNEGTAPKLKLVITKP